MMSARLAVRFFYGEIIDTSWTEVKVEPDA